MTTRSPTNNMSGTAQEAVARSSATRTLVTVLGFAGGVLVVVLLATGGGLGAPDR